MCFPRTAKSLILFLFVLFTFLFAVVLSVGAITFFKWFAMFWTIRRLANSGLIRNSHATSGTNVVFHNFILIKGIDEKCINFSLIHVVEIHVIAMEIRGKSYANETPVPRLIDIVAVPFRI